MVCAMCWTISVITAHSGFGLDARALDILVIAQVDGACIVIILVATAEHTQCTILVATKTDHHTLYLQTRHSSRAVSFCRAALAHFDGN